MRRFMDHPELLATMVRMEYLERMASVVKSACLDPRATLESVIL